MKRGETFTNLGAVWGAKLVRPEAEVLTFNFTTMTITQLKKAAMAEAESMINTGIQRKFRQDTFKIDYLVKDFRTRAVIIRGSYLRFASGITYPVIINPFYKGAMQSYPVIFHDHASRDTGELDLGLILSYESSPFESQPFLGTSFESPMFSCIRDDISAAYSLTEVAVYCHRKGYAININNVQADREKLEAEIQKAKEDIERALSQNGAGQGSTPWRFEFSAAVPEGVYLKITGEEETDVTYCILNLRRNRGTLTIDDFSEGSQVETYRSAKRYFAKYSVFSYEKATEAANRWIKASADLATLI